MKRFTLLLVLILALAVPANCLVALGSVTDISGNSAAHPLSATAASARWVQFIAPSTNTNQVRVGGANVGATTGASIAPGGGFMSPSIPTDAFQPVVGNNYYDLRPVYYYVATGDKLTVVWSY